MLRIAAASPARPHRHPARQRSLPAASAANRVPRRLCDKGTSALELALLGPPFMLLVFMIFEIGFQLTVGAALEYGVHRAGRLSIIEASASASGMARASTLKTAVLAATGGLLQEARLTVTPLSFDHVASMGAEAQANVGPNASKKIMRYELTYTQPLLTGSLAEVALNSSELTHSSTVVVVDEPF